MDAQLLTLVTFVAVFSPLGDWLVDWWRKMLTNQTNHPQDQFQFTLRQKVLEIVGHAAKCLEIILYFASPSFLFSLFDQPLRENLEGAGRQEIFLLHLIITAWSPPDRLE